MNEKVQRKVFQYFFKNKIENFVGVPDSTIKYFIDEGFIHKKILIATREEEAIGIATGMSLANSPSLVFMQNAGFGNSISTITSLVQLYNIPLIFLIGWRGYLPDDAPEHIKFGKIQPELIKSLGLKSKVINDSDWEKSCKWALTQLNANKPCLLIIKREFHD
tara:strand:- start:280 stop:768 length:489 start_codon:yes stop_codon:yes gene_type:complete